MTPSFAIHLDALSDWRATLVRRLDELGGFLSDHELASAPTAAPLAAMRERLAQQKLVVAFVAEFSRGKSELINAIFFGDTGRRILPATPGRTTMCPVELGWDAADAPALRLLAIETRLEGLPLSELRRQPSAWKPVALKLDDPEHLATALQEVTQTQWVAKDRARDLGFWDDARPDDNPPVDAEDHVEVPVWRHALINYPHPLLKQGLVVLDTPGLNAIGAEPELTLSLLPSAHATVFILAADAGVTQSDLGIWRDHLGTKAMTRFVVLNKIDTLRDPLASAAQVDKQIVSQRAEASRTLGVALDRVFPLSARQALAARVAGDEHGLQESRLPALEAALGSQLLPQRRHVLEQAVIDGAQQLETQVVRWIGDRRRHLAEQMLELRGLRGKSGSKINLMLARVDAETAEFEQCTVRLQALRTVHSRMLRGATVCLSSHRLREEIAQMQDEMKSLLLNLGAKRAFVAFCARLRAILEGTATRSTEIREMLGASFAKLNAEFGFSLALAKSPDFQRFDEELALIERSYTQYLGLTQAMRLSQPKFMAQFRGMLASKLQIVFESASAELEQWNKTASAQIDSQLRERRRNFKRRRESLERVQAASGELETRLAELESQDARLQGLSAGARGLIAALRDDVRAGPAPAGELISLALTAAASPAIGVGARDSIQDSARDTTRDPVRDPARLRRAEV